MTNKSNNDPTPMDGSAREKLLAAALALFNAKGYAATSVREIVEAAGVSKPVLYYYFSSKEGIYLEIMTTTFARFHDIIQHTVSAGGSARQRLLDFSMRIFDGFVDNIQVMQLLFAIFFGPPQGAPAFRHDEYFNRMIEVIGSIVEEGVAAGEFTTVDRNDISWMVLSCLNTVMEEQLCHSPPRVDKEGLVRMLGMVVDGITQERA